MSISEGELKNRILSFIDRNVTDTPSAKEAMKYAVSGIIDEVKADFPIHRNYRTRPMIEEGEVLAWLRKWLGELK